MAYLLWLCEVVEWVGVKSVVCEAVEWVRLCIMVYSINV